VDNPFAARRVVSRRRDGWLVGWLVVTNKHILTRARVECDPTRRERTQPKDPIRLVLVVMSTDDRDRDGDDDSRWHVVAPATALQRPDARLPLCVDGRHVIALRTPRGALRCVDATCYHMGGPLLRADIEEVPGKGECVSCPWHRYHIALDTGERVYRDLSGETRCIAGKQRVHEIEEVTNGDDSSSVGVIRVRLSVDGEWESDRYAKKAPPPSVSAGYGGGMPRSGEVFAARGMMGKNFADGVKREFGPGARSSGMKSMVAQSMRGGDGVAPWAVGGGDEEGRATGAGVGGSGMSVRKVRKRVAFATDEEENDSEVH